MFPICVPAEVFGKQKGGQAVVFVAETTHETDSLSSSRGGRREYAMCMPTKDNRQYRQCKWGIWGHLDATRSFPYASQEREMDIVETLRWMADPYGDGRLHSATDDLMVEAADEITRLRADNNRLQKGIRAALDLLSDGPGGPRRVSAMRLLNDLTAQKATNA